MLFALLAPLTVRCPAKCLLIHSSILFFLRRASKSCRTCYTLTWKTCLTKLLWELVGKRMSNHTSTHQNMLSRTIERALICLVLLGIYCLMDKGRWTWIVRNSGMQNLFMRSILRLLPCMLPWDVALPTFFACLSSPIALKVMTMSMHLTIRECSSRVPNSC